jgi:hypothetical protein
MTSPMCSMKRVSLVSAEVSRCVRWPSTYAAEWTLLKFGVHYEYTGFIVSDTFDLKVKNPPAVRQFIANVDLGGGYPELIYTRGQQQEVTQAECQLMG